MKKIEEFLIKMGNNKMLMLCLLPITITLFILFLIWASKATVYTSAFLLMFLFLITWTPLVITIFFNIKHLFKYLKSKNIL